MAVPAEQGSSAASVELPMRRSGAIVRRAWRQRALVALSVLLVVAALVTARRFDLWARRHESTDDAFIDGRIVFVAPQVAGRVRRVLVTDNQPVQEGHLLAEIDPADFRVRLAAALASRAGALGRLAQTRAQLAVADASRAQAAADIVAAQAEADHAASDLTRYRASTVGAISQQALDAARTTAERTAAELSVKRKAALAADAQVAVARARIAAAEADLRAAGAQVAQARLQLSYTKVRATEAGRVTEKSVQPGDYVQVGQQLLALVTADVWVTANFKETQLRRLRPGQRAAIRVDAYGRDFLGQVDSIQAGSGARFSLLPPENATGNYVKVVQRVPVKIVFDALPEGVLLGPGMSAVPAVEVE